VTGFTLAYMGRLELWALTTVALQGGLVLSSWLVWERAMRTSSAEVRHRLACVHFAALAILPALTVAILQGTVIGMSAAPSGDGSHLVASQPLNLGDRTLAPLAWSLAGLWLAGAAVLAVKLAADLWKIARLRSAPAPEALAEAVRRLASGWLGDSLPDVRTADVAAPQIVGWRRPVLLAPYDLAQRLPAAECDAVLRHELAHVRRRDFAWNLLQRLVLAVVWFQPAAWALYAQLAREREVCCDSLAVRQGASATDLARALVRLAENPSQPGLALGFFGQGDLTARVRRLLGSPPPVPPRRRRLCVAGALISVLCVAALGAGRLADPSMRDLYVASAFGPTISIQAHDPAGSFALRVRHGRVVEASVGAWRLPSARILQSGRRVILVGSRKEPIVTLMVTPAGHIRWHART
jgi:beta-lactamase regulating signal transducer with metallopeptidase domain